MAGSIYWVYAPPFSERFLATGTMAEPRSVPRKMSAGVILLDGHGRVLMQLRDDDPTIMFPGHWGITGGAGHPGETPEEPRGERSRRRRDYYWDRSSRSARITSRNRRRTRARAPRRSPAPSTSCTCSTRRATRRPRRWSAARVASCGSSRQTRLTGSTSRTTTARC